MTDTVLVKKDFGASIIVPIDRKTGRIALVWEPSKPRPIYWKFPGGWIEWFDVDPLYPDDDFRMASNAARREAKEETGLTIARTTLLYTSLEKGRYRKYFSAGFADFSELIRKGGDGEVVQRFSLEQVHLLKNFHPRHRKALDMLVQKMGEIRAREKQ